MILSATPGSLKRLRRIPWRFQQTFLTPLKNLNPFVATILSGRKPAEGGTVIIDSVVFDPKHLKALLASHSLPPSFSHEFSMEATGKDEVESLLRAALSDSVDFWFIPTPKPFVIYADHDEYATFFANTKSNLNGVVEPLVKQGFEKVQYKRYL